MSINHDPSIGLRYVANNENLYRKVLGKFADQQAHTAQDITTALRNGDTELAHRLAHTLKGLAASMGLPPLAQTATDLDVAFKTGEDPSDILTLLQTRLDEALQDVSLYLGTGA